MSKFNGSFQDLQDKVLLTGVAGEWKDLGNQKQYKTVNGAVLNWWQSNKTIQFQGNKEAAVQLEDDFSKTEAAVGTNSSSVIDSLPVDDKTKIFIVHGHDTMALEQLELVLRRLGLDPFILQNNDSQSKTIIEALEKRIYEEAAFGIVLMTPDDYGYPKTKTNDERQPRVRQNVILEMGTVLASLGRDKMVILKKGNLELPSDVNGIIYLEFNDHVKEVAVRLANRMKEAGIKIADNLIMQVAA